MFSSSDFMLESEDEAVTGAVLSMPDVAGEAAEEEGSTPGGRAGGKKA